jgi:hypothetical protein
MTSDHDPQDLIPSEAALRSLRMAAEAAGFATCHIATESDVDDTLAALSEAIAQAALSRRLIGAVEDAAARSSVSMESLRQAVCDFTRASKGDGATPEAVLITLKAIVNQHRLPLLPRYMADWSGDRLHAAISTWCIEAYFKS